MKDYVSRRFFLKSSLCAAASFYLGQSADVEAARARGLVEEARYYVKIPPDLVQCQLCFHQCPIPEGGRGVCRNRENRRGTLFTLVYGRAGAIHVDPIEKEPMFHNLPGTEIICTGTAGCNFKCRFCHNWHLSQSTPEELALSTHHVQPEEIVRVAERRGAGLSFTYNEPTVFYEYMYDTAMLGKKKGLNVICHTNGAIRPEPLKALLVHLDGVTVDLKGFTADAYRDNSSAELIPVLETLKIIKAEGKWLEIVNLLIPTLNDDLKTVREMCRWIRHNLGADVPLHFTRFFPAYRLTHLSPTPIKSLEAARETAVKEGLLYVYIGNVPGHKYNSTFCARCQKRLVTRRHFTVEAVEIKKGNCRFCGQPIPGIWRG